MPLTSTKGKLEVVSAISLAFMQEQTNRGISVMSFNFPLQNGAIAPLSPLTSNIISLNSQHKTNKQNYDNEQTKKKLPL